MLYNSCFFTRTTHFSLFFICFFSYSCILILPYFPFSSFFFLFFPFYPFLPSIFYLPLFFVIFLAIFPSSLSVVYVAVLRQPPLHPQKQKKSEHSRTSKLRRQDSNVRPPGYEPGELPTAPLRDVFSLSGCKSNTFRRYFQIFPFFFSSFNKNTAFFARLVSHE